MITAFYALPLTALYIWLSYRVIALRKSARISLGDGGRADLQARMRAHGNLAEYAPLGLVLMALAELAGLSAAALHLTGVALLGGRVLHAWGVGGAGLMRARIAGMALTFTALALGAGGAVLATLLG